MGFPWCSGLTAPWAELSGSGIALLATVGTEPVLEIPGADCEFALAALLGVSVEQQGELVHDVVLFEVLAFASGRPRWIHRRRLAGS